MNTAILHGARPSDSKPKGAFGGLPPEALAMARQLGLSTADLKQMESMWKNMDDLAESDPDTYKDFVSKHLAEGPPKPASKSFLPVPGFVVKLRQTNGVKLFMNLASHEAIERPKDAGDRPVKDSDRNRSASGLQVPMLVSTVRQCRDGSGEQAVALDVVFHPWVVTRCEEEPPFKAQIVSLAIDWARQEANLSLVPTWKTIRSKYKGGDGPQADQPVPFPLSLALAQEKPVGDRDDVDEQAASSEEKMPDPAAAAQAALREAVLRSPASSMTPESILKAAAGPMAEPTPSGISLPPPGTIAADGPKAHDGQVQRTVRIEEVDPSSGRTKAAPQVAPQAEPGKGTRQAAPRGPAKPAVKKGFLSNDKSAPLYGESGSENGGKEGSYSKLMSRCKVVDLSTMSPEDQQKAMRQHAEPKPAEHPPVPAPVAPVQKTATAPEQSLADPAATFSGLGKGFLGEKGLLAKGDPGGSKRSAHSLRDEVFDSLIAGIDPDYADASRPMEDPTKDNVFQSLSEIAKVLGTEAHDGAAPARQSSVTAKESMTRKSKAAATPVQYSMHTEANPNNGRRTARVSVDFEGQAFQVSDTALEMGEASPGKSVLRLLVSGKAQLDVDLPFTATDENVRARFSKKRNALVVTVEEASTGGL